MIIYAVLKFEMLLQRQNPSISTTDELSALDEKAVLNLAEANLKLAFHAENFDSELLNDPRYVRFIVSNVGEDDGEWVEKPIKFHKCTEAELLEFAPLTPDAQSQLDDITASESRSLFCIDWENVGKEIDLFGYWTNQNHRYLEIILAPCNFVPWGFEDVYPVADECIWDEEAQRQYLKSFNMRLLVEDETFEQDEYGKRSISRRSRFH